MRMASYKKIVNLLIFSGKKQIGIKLINFCFLFIKIFFKINPAFIFKKAMSCLIPFFELKKIQKGTQSSYSVKFTKTERRQALCLRWVIAIARESNSKFYKQLALELYNSSMAKGRAFDKKVELLKKAEVFKNI